MIKATLMTASKHDIQYQSVKENQNKNKNNRRKKELIYDLIMNKFKP